MTQVSERPWGKLAVSSVEQLPNAKHFPFPSQGHTDGEKSQDSKQVFVTPQTSALATYYLILAGAFQREAEKRQNS